MPIDAQTGLTYAELMLEVAIEFNLHSHPSGGGAAILPTDPADLDLVSKAVNRGYDYFLRSSRNWSFGFERISVLLNSAGTGPSNLKSDTHPNGDPGNYRLPGYVSGRARSNWSFVDSDIRYGYIRDIKSSVLEEYRQSSNSTGRPYFAATRAFETKDSITGAGVKAWELLIYPRPEQEYTIAADFRVTSHRLREDGERHIAGADHDMAIRACAFYEACRLLQHGSELPRYKDDRNEQIALSHELDLGNRPSRLGQLASHDPAGVSISTHTRSDLGRMLINDIDPNP